MRRAIRSEEEAGAFVVAGASYGAGGGATGARDTLAQRAPLPHQTQAAGERDIRQRHTQRHISLVGCCATVNQSNGRHNRSHVNYVLHNCITLLQSHQNILHGN